MSEVKIYVRRCVEIGSLGVSVEDGMVTIVKRNALGPQYVRLSMDDLTDVLRAAVALDASNRQELAVWPR